MNSLDGTLKVIQKEVVAFKRAVEDERARLDKASTRTAKWDNHCDYASALATTCRKEPLNVEKHLATSHKMAMACSAHDVALEKQRDTVDTKYGELYLSMRQLDGFSNM